MQLLVLLSLFCLVTYRADLNVAQKTDGLKSALSEISGLEILANILHHEEHAHDNYESALFYKFSIFLNYKDQPEILSEISSSELYISITLEKNIYSMVLLKFDDSGQFVANSVASVNLHTLLLHGKADPDFDFSGFDDEQYTDSDFLQLFAEQLQTVTFELYVTNLLGEIIHTLDDSPFSASYLPQPGKYELTKTPFKYLTRATKTPSASNDSLSVISTPTQSNPVNTENLLLEFPTECSLLGSADAVVLNKIKIANSDYYHNNNIHNDQHSDHSSTTAIASVRVLCAIFTIDNNHHKVRSAH